MEICIAVADRARGPMTWVPGVPGGEGTGARPRRRKHRARRHGPIRPRPTWLRARRLGLGREAGVAEWG
ncbi:hypothetical protein GBW32_21560 [Streptomyces tsukubensis]|uniref:Uncharacterized protein n=1 Tax=Streptomyces tsukubensis TaxID=83656 RepID=A0A1V4A8E9_9ACTN|nr:hypothetical protein B1H18_16400 [Streptomyces tsukubensis]QFR95135.1 hypothetical protein GBW32_21560 [Streptomyces tsukubensis]